MSALSTVERDVMRQYGAGAQLAQIAATHGMPAGYLGELVNRLCGYNRQRAVSVAREGVVPPGAGETLTASAPTAAKPKRLSATELLVLPLLADRALSLGDIADQLDRTYSSIASAATGIYLKLAVQSRARAVAEARRRGLLPAAEPVDAVDDTEVALTEHVEPAPVDLTDIVEPEPEVQEPEPVVQAEPEPTAPLIATTTTHKPLVSACLAASSVGKQPAVIAVYGTDWCTPHGYSGPAAEHRCPDVRPVLVTVSEVANA